MYRNIARTLALIRSFYLSECSETLPELWHSFELFTSQNISRLCPNFGTHSNFFTSQIVLKLCPNFGTHSNFYLSECTETLPELWHSFELLTSQNVQKLCPNFGIHSNFLPLRMYRNFARALALIRTFLPLRMYRNLARTLALIRTFYLSEYRNFARTLALIRTFYLLECTETLPKLWHSVEPFTSQNVPKLCTNFGTPSNFLPLRMYRNFARTLALIRTFLPLRMYRKFARTLGNHSNFLPLRVYRNFARTLALIRTFYLSECTETLHELWHSVELFTSQNVLKPCPNFGTHSNILPLRMYRNFARTLALFRSFYRPECTETLPELWHSLEPFLPLRMYRKFARTLGNHPNFSPLRMYQTLPELCHSFELFTSQNVPKLCPYFGTFTHQNVPKLYPNFGHSGTHMSFVSLNSPTELWVNLLSLLDTLFKIFRMYQTLVI
jgi:hypothetical protein